MSTDMISGLPLTSRQRDVFELMCANKNNAEICELLGIAYETLRTHKKHLYAAFGVRGQKDLMVLAYQHKLIRPSEHGPDWVRTHSLTESEIDELALTMYLSFFGKEARPWRTQTPDTKRRFRAAVRMVAELHQAQLRRSS